MAPGAYLVINHDTGQRFTNIEIADLDSGVGVQDANIILQAANASDFFSGQYQLLSSGGLNDFPAERFLRETITSDGSTILYDKSIDCSDGGMVYQLDQTVLTNVPTARITYDHCVLGTTTLSGTLTRTSTIGNGSSERFGSIRIDNEKATVYIENAYWEDIFSFGVIKFSADQYSVENDSYSFNVSNLDTELKPNTPFSIPGIPSLVQSFILTEINGNNV